MTKLTNDARAIPADPIDAEHAQIYWNETDEGPNRVCDVSIIDCRAVHKNPRIDDAWDYCGGAANAAWLKPKEGRDFWGTGSCELTPEGAFGGLCAVGFKDPVELHRAIYEFARIKGATWAQRMLRALSQEQEDAALALPDPVARMRRVAA